ncbi:MAG: hypothetical protein ABSF66_03360 [Terriglobales bacterium]|jgi:hypothetical protein
MTRLSGHDEGEISRILSREEEILPSSGFAISVMDAVRREAAAPPPIPFPWKRALPGLVVGGFALALVFLTLVVAIAQLLRASTSAHFSMSLPSVLTPIFGLGLQRNLEIAASWTVLALLVAFVSVKLSMRLASGRV